MYLPCTIYRPAGIESSLCIFIMHRLYKQGATCKHFVLSNNPHALAAVVLEANSSVREVRLNTVCSTRLLDKLQSDFCHFNIMTDYVLTVSFDPNQFSHEAVKAIVDNAMARYFEHSLCLAVCYETKGEIAFLVEISITDSLIADHEKRIVLGPMARYPQEGWPLTYSLPDAVFARSPLAFREKRSALTREYYFLKDQIPENRYSAETQRRLVEFDSTKSALFELNFAARQSLNLAMSHYLYHIDTPLNTYLDQRLPSFLKNKVEPWDMAKIERWFNSIDQSNTWEIMKHFILDGDGISINTSMANPSLPKSDNIFKKEAQLTDSQSKEQVVVLDKQFNIDLSKAVDMPSIYQLVEDLANNTGPETRVTAVYARYALIQHDDRISKVSLVVSIAVPISALFGDEESYMCLSTEHSFVVSYLEQYANMHVMKRREIIQPYALSPLQSAESVIVADKIAKVYNELLELWSKLANQNSYRLKEQ